MASRISSYSHRQTFEPGRASPKGRSSDVAAFVIGVMVHPILAEQTFFSDRFVAWSARHEQQPGLANQSDSLPAARPKPRATIRRVSHVTSSIASSFALSAPTQRVAVFG